jgi:UDPglucose 6-dehydrogenase
MLLLASPESSGLLRLTVSSAVRNASESGIAASGLTIIETVLAGNEARKARMADKIVAALGGSVAGRILAVLGLTFKPNTDDMREAPSLAILPRLIAAGATIRAFDPAGIPEASKLLPEPVYCPDAYTTLAGAEALVLLTEWNGVPRPRPRPHRAAAEAAAGDRSA